MTFLLGAPPCLSPLLLLLCAPWHAFADESPTTDVSQGTTKPGYRETKPNKFVAVNVACTRSTLMVVASMNDPFYGLVYARGFPQACRSTSEGQRRVKLKVNVEDCGVKVVEDEGERSHYEMMVYIQYDRHVQQAIDEQVLVRCDPEERIVVKASMGKQREDAEPADLPKQTTDAAVKTVKTTTEAAVRAHGEERPLEEVYPVSLGEGLWRHGVEGRANRADVAAEEFSDVLPLFLQEEQQELMEERRAEQKLERPEVARCWLDILKGEGLEGQAFFEHLDVGDATTMLIKTRLNDESDSQDVLVTNCSAHDGSEARSQQLIDVHGCTVDDTIMSPVQEHPHHGLGHRLHYATFNAFKFPERTSLHLRCTVLVCRGGCPRRTCRPHRLARAARIGHGSITPLSDAELRAPATYPIGRLLDTLQVNIKDGSVVLEKIEVFNSAEVRAPGIESVATRRHSPNSADRVTRVAGQDSFFSDDRLLCMTSSRLLLSFGVLMAILIVSVLLALLMCMKQRQQARKLRTLQTFQRIATPRPAPTPHYFRVGPL